MNYITITWVFFISIVLLFPTATPVTPTNMNYAVAVAAFIAIFSLGWWYVVSHLPPALFRSILSDHHPKPPARLSRA